MLDLECANRLAKLMLDYLCVLNTSDPIPMLMLGTPDPRDYVVLIAE